MNALIRALGPSNIKLKFLPGLVGPQGPVGPPAQPVASQAEAEAGVASDKSMTPERTKQAIVALGGSANFTASGTGAVTRTVAEKLGDWINAIEFIPANLRAGVALWTITTDLTPYLNAAADAAAGNGVLNLPRGLLTTTTGWTIGNGSNSAQSTKHHRLWVVGAGRGASPSLSNAQAEAGTCIKYIGTTDTAKAVVELAGPLHNIQLSNFQIDCDGKAGIGLLVNHVTDFQFNRVQVMKFTSRAYKFTTRTGFPTGAPYGCGNGVVFDCYAYDPANNTATAVELTSGVSTATTLAGNPDSANIDFFGGLYFYGGSTGSAGVSLAGADNNTFYGAQFLPASGNDGGGKSVLFTQWPGSPSFPLENAFYNLGKNQGVGGTSGTGGNTFVMFSESDGAAIPTLDYITTRTHSGKEYVNGQRVYRSVPSIAIKSADQGTASNSFVEVTGLSATIATKAATKLRVSFNGLVSKFTAGSGDFVIALNGSARGHTSARILATGDYGSVSAGDLIDVGQGSQTVSIQFKSSDANQVHIAAGTLIVEMLY